MNTNYTHIHTNETNETSKFIFDTQIRIMGTIRTEQTEISLKQVKLKK